MHFLKASLLTKICAVFALWIGSSFASVFDHPVSDNSRKQLSMALNQMTSHAVVYGDFKQVKSIKKLNRDFVSTGNFMISKSYGIAWNTLKPFASMLMVTSGGISQQSGNGPVKKMASQENPVFAEFSKTIQAVFSGNCQELENNFTVYFEKKGNDVVIGLIPKEATVRKVIANIVMEGSVTLDKITITDGEGNPIVYEFSKQKLLNDSQMDSLLSSDDMTVKIYRSLSNP